MATTQIEKPNNPVAAIRSFISNPEVKKRLEEMLGKRAGAFANSIINVVKSNKMLQECVPDSVMSAAMIAATMNLAIDPALGYAAIVPYKSKGGTMAQFQLMYKGMIQLCIRSGQYAKIHVTEIYADEIKSYNPITGDIQFNASATFKMRYDGNPDGVINPKNVVGVYAYFKLTTGFECSIYMSKDEAIAHGKRFSKAYQYDLREKKQTSLWSNDPVSMMKKTAIKMLLSRYGIMSIELQEAFVEEDKDFTDAAQDAHKMIEGDAGSEPVDATFEPEPQAVPAGAESSQEQPDWMKGL